MERLRATVVIPTFNRRDSLERTLKSLKRQTQSADVRVVDNMSTDGTVELLHERFPQVLVVRNDANLGFGRAVNRGARTVTGGVLVILNNDIVCEPAFIEEITAPFDDPEVGMVAGVLVQGGAPHLVDSAGVELDETLGSWDYLWNQPIPVLTDSPPRPPLGPCGGAAAYRTSVFHELGGFDENLFAYWEDVDLAIRISEAGHRCVLALGALALHEHGATLGLSSIQRELHAFGRGYMLGKYRVLEDLRARLKVALLDWPTLFIHLLVRREAGPIRQRSRGLRAGRTLSPSERTRPAAAISVRKALSRQFEFARLRLRRRLPRHFYRPKASEAGEGSANR